MLFRQTNIIWVAFVAAQSIGPYFIHTIHCAQIEQTNQQTPAKFSLTTTGQFWEVSFSCIYYLVISYHNKSCLIINHLNLIQNSGLYR